MGLSDEPEARPDTPPGPKPDAVAVTFHVWLDHVLACGDCFGGGPTTARLCYHSERLGDRHREAGRAARPRS
jgi:hypothetical protein